MAYSTVAKIRQEAGFQNNDSVTDPVLTVHQNAAFSIVKGYVARRYSIAQLAGAQFTNSQASLVLEEAERLYAAGLALNDLYSGQQMGETNGKAKIDAALKILEDIAAGTLKLLDVDDNVFSADVATAAGITPSLTSPPRLNPNPESSERKFSVDKKW